MAQASLPLWGVSSGDAGTVRQLCGIHVCQRNSSLPLPRQGQDVLTSSPYLPLDLQMGKEGLSLPSCLCPDSWWGNILVQVTIPTIDTMPAQARNSNPSAKAASVCSVGMICQGIWFFTSSGKCYWKVTDIFSRVLLSFFLSSLWSLSRPLTQFSGMASNPFCPAISPSHLFQPGGRISLAQNLPGLGL